MRLYPAIKARMGDWDYYLVRMTMREVASEVRLASDLWEDRTLSTAIQRTLDESRVKEQLVNFLSRRDDRFFSSLVVAAIGGNPSWSPIETPIGIGRTAFRDTFGTLAFDEDPKYYALDGQHRLKAIGELMADLAGAPPDFEREQVSVIVVIRDPRESEASWLPRYRRLFSSLNRYAKPTDADTNIIMDEDDLFAIVTRRLITDHDFFRTHETERRSFRVLTKGKNLKSGASHFISLQALYEVNKALLMTTENRRRWGRAKDLKAFLQFRPDEHEIDAHYASLTTHWDALLAALPCLREGPEHMREHQLPDPNPDGLRDHLLFWPIGQELVAPIARRLLDRAGLPADADVDPLRAALQPLAEVPWELHDPPWRHLLLIATPSGDGASSSWRIRNEERKAAIEVGARLVQWIVGLDALGSDETEALRKDWLNLLYPEPPSSEEAEEMWSRLVTARTRIVAGS